MTRREQTLALLGGAFIAVYFFSLTHDALHAFFALDDSGNLYRAWYYPLPELFRANLLFFLTSPFNRPMGSAWYRAIFSFAGYNPVPFHIANLAILTANLWLTYALSRRLSGSREVGALAALLMAYHPRFAYLYFDTAYIYDVLCYFFYFATLLLYVRVRQQQRWLNGWELAACCGLFICALNSKQMAVTIPVALAAYELLYDHVPMRSPRGLLRWLMREGRFIVLSAVMTLAFVVGQSFGPDSYLENKAYQPVITAGRFMTTSRNITSDIFLQHIAFSFSAVLLLWIALLVVAWAARSRALKFAWLFLMFSVLPIAFIDRGAPQYYIPLFGWALYAATVLGAGSRHLLERFSRTKTNWLAYARGPALFVLLGLLMFKSYRRTGWPDVPFVSLEGEMLRNVADQVRLAHPQVKPGARLLFIDDPMGPNDLDLMFLARMVYRDPTLEVNRVKTPPSPAPKLAASADYFYDYRFGRFFPSVLPQPERPEPALAFEWGHPAVYHEGWERVTDRSPARPGELVIAMVTDLGDTKPPVAPGQPFPKEPLLEIAGQVDVRVAGNPTPIAVKIGWPEQINRYRLDFRIPQETPSGLAPVVISAGAVTGPAVDIPIE
ncbi:MAG TPA: glycosyltransferase family 39 protein [Bryobacteraceae bacterium]|nr:glycosyltransferase family 39 protein [Bryobacteraceae bacterium]